MPVLPWLAQSSDLNLIEHLIEHLMRLFRQANVILKQRFKQTFEHALTAKFYLIDKKFCKNGQEVKRSD